MIDIYYFLMPNMYFISKRKPMLVGLLITYVTGCQSL